MNTGLMEILHRVLIASDSELAQPQKSGSHSPPVNRNQEVVARAMDRHGPGLLLSAGLVLHRKAEPPALACLRRDPAPQIIADKFSRLERYYGSSCRTRINLDGNRWNCSRINMEAAVEPGENYLVAGVLMGLLKDTGHRNIAITYGAQKIDIQNVLRAQLHGGETGDAFAISWTGHDQPGPMPEPECSELSAHLAAVLAADIGRSWKIEDCAARLGLSTRSLQPYLKAEGLHYSDVVRRTRTKAAALLLANPAVSLAEVGYCCGYADQAHFQRDFRRAAGKTPRQFRETGLAAS